MGAAGAQQLFCNGFRPRAVLLSGGVHAFPGASDHERNDNILKGRWRSTRANGSHDYSCGPVHRAQNP